MSVTDTSLPDSGIRNGPDVGFFETVNSPAPIFWMTFKVLPISSSMRMKWPLFVKRFGTPNILDSILLIRLQDLYSQVCVLSQCISYSDGHTCLLHACYVPASGLDSLHLKIHIIRIKIL